MTNLKSKYTPEFRERTVKYIIENNKSATGAAEELGIDKNTVCSWVCAYSRANKLPSYKEEMDIRGKGARDAKSLALKLREDKHRILELEEMWKS